MMAQSCKNQISSVFNMNGYTLRSEASKYLQAVLGDMDAQERSVHLKKVIAFLESQSLTSALIEKSILEQSLQNFGSADGEEEVLLKIIDAFSMPSYIFHNETKKFVLTSSLKKHVTSLFALADSKADMYIEKYKMIRQRTLRHRLFAPPAIATDSSIDTSFSLKSVEHLLGASSKQTNLIVLGMLTQLKEGQFFLEDPTGCVKLNLSHATYKEGLFTENSIVLAEGYCQESVFHVTAIGFPPPEPASVTLSHFPHFDISSATSTVSSRLSEKLRIVEKKSREAMFVFLSDVWLDQLKIMQKLHILFAGYAQFPPTCFVLIGNFLSLSNSGTHSKHFSECFEKLGNMIGEFPSLVTSSTFVIVPGPDDPSFPSIFPRPPIPETMITGFRKKVPKAIFTSNPCRIQFCSQEMIIFREDIVSKMCRNTLYMPWQHGEKVDIPGLFVKTIIANSHLLPLPLNVSPIYWEFDHALWLYPLPDVIVCADKCDPYAITSTGAVFFNPGSLPRTNFSFKVYIPASKQVEDSQITDDLLP